jgi:hypothetical protein
MSHTTRDRTGPGPALGRDVSMRGETVDWEGEHLAHFGGRCAPYGCGG